MIKTNNHEEYFYQRNITRKPKPRNGKIVEANLLGLPKNATPSEKELEQINSNITSAENEINKIVYDLYDISDNEIAIIEKSINL